MNDVPEAEAASPVQVRCYFVRHRNALAVRARFSDLFMDYYLHQIQTGMKPGERLDGMVKDALAAITLHAASRPWAEAHAWTINFQEPRANFFVSGDNTTGRVVGRVFTENVKVRDTSLFYSQVLVKGAEPRTSAIEVEGNDMLGAVEQYYERSEQRLGRFFRHEPEDIVFISAQPGCDLEWLAGLDDEKVRRMDHEEELSLLEERAYHWECGCTRERLYQVLEPHARAGLEQLFAEDEFLTVTCPRCAAQYRVQREQFEAWLAESGSRA